MIQGGENSSIIMSCRACFFLVLAFAQTLLGNTDPLKAIREQRFFAPDDGGATGDSFGLSVAASGEWAVVGAPTDDSAFFTDEGSAYVLKRQTNGTWAIHQKLSLPMTEQERYRQGSGIYFGQTVAISGDWIAVGAPHFQQTSSPRGRVVLYKRTGESWQPAQSIDRPSGYSADNLGSGLALSGSTLLIGTSLDGSSGTPYVYAYNLVTKPTETWTLQCILNGPGGADCGFGRTLAIRSGNAIIGLPGFLQGSGNDRGEVREYSLANGDLLTTLRPPNRDVVLRFGGTLSVSGNRMLIGLRPTGPQVLPIAYLYERGASSWTLIGTVGLPADVPYPNLDCPVALTPTRAVVGAAGEVSMTLVNVAIGPGAMPSLQTSVGITTKLYYSLPIASPLNHILAVTGEDTLASDVNNQDLILNSPSRSGCIAAVTPRQPPLSPGLMTSRMAPALTHLIQNDEMGTAVATFGDTAVVSAPRWNNNRGSVHVFTRQGFLWSYSHSLDNPAPVNGGDPLPFGGLVSVNRDWIAVNGLNKMYVYQRAGGVWARTPTYSIMSRINAPAPVLNMELDQQPGFEDSLVVAYYGGRTPMLVERYRLTPTQPELLGSRDENNSFPANPIATSGGLALTMTQTTTGRELGLFTTHQTPWLQQARLLPPTGTDLPAQYYSGDGLTFDGKTIMVGDRRHGGWPIAYDLRGKIWVATEIRDKTQNQNVPASFAARGDTCVLVLGNSFLVWTRQAGVWQYNQNIIPGINGFRDRPENLTSSALSADTAVIGSRFSSTRFGMVSMHYLPQMLAYEGPSPAVGRALSNGLTLDAGEVAIGADTNIRLTLQNNGSMAWSVTPATISFRHPLSNTTVLFDGLSQTPVSPNGSTPLILKIRPAQPGQQTMILDIATTAGTQVLTSVSVRFNAVAQPALPGEAPLVSPQLIALGKPMVLRAPDAISRSLRFQWFKEGRLLSGETQPFLFNPAVTSATAGTYELEIIDSSNARLRIKDILVGVYEPKSGSLSLRRDQAFTLSVRAWGPGIQFQWLNGQDTPFIRGSHTPTLQVTRADHAPSFVSAALILGTTLVVPWQWDVTLVPYPEITSASPLVFVHNVALVIADPQVTSTGPLQVTSFTASGLPPGIKLDGTSGRFTGTPTAQGTFISTLTGYAADHQSHTIQTVIRVVGSMDELGYASGSLAGKVGYVDADISPLPGHSLSGLMRLQVSSTGSLSGTWLVRDQRLSFQGQLSQSGDSLTRSFGFKLPGIPGFKGFECRLNQQNTQPYIELFMTATDAMGNTYDSRHELYPVAPATMANRDLYAGRFSALLTRDRSPDDPRPETAEGSGFMSFTIDSAMQSTGAGSLPDGAGFTTSGVVLDEGMGILMTSYQLPGDWLAATLYRQDNGTLKGTADWNRAPRPGNRLYPAGLRDPAIQVSAARYFPPATGMTLLPALDPAKGSALLTLNENGSTSARINPFRLTPQHTALFPAPNASKLRLSFYSPTGFFTGQFTFDDLLPGSLTQRLQRTSTFRGMVVPGFNRGEGFFLLPQLPDPAATPPITSANSPILSGKVSITQESSE